MDSSSFIENIPFGAPPPSQSSNFENPETRGPAVVVVCSVFIALMWPIFLLRLYSKVWVIHSFGWDDASAMLAAAGATAFGACTIWLTNTFGPHAWDVRAIAFTNKVIVMQIMGAGIVVYSIAIFFAKLALFLLYLRIFALNRWTKIAIYIGITVSCLFYTSAIIADLVLCIPRRGETWASLQFSVQCYPILSMTWAQGIYGLVSDLYIFILPLPVLWGLQMALRKKLAVTAIFFAGLIAIIASALGLYYRVTNSIHPDLTWNLPPSLCLALIEMTIGVICSSIPHLPPLIRRHGPSISYITHFVRKLLTSYRTKPRRNSESPFHASEPKANTPTPQKAQLETHVLGSMKGDGKFINSGRFSRIFRNQPSTLQSGGTTTLEATGATRRDYYETKETEQPLHTHPTPKQAHPKSTSPWSSTQPSQSSSEGTELDNVSEIISRAGTSHHAAGNMMSNTEREGEKSSGKQSESHQKGYWDIMSIFRSGNRSTVQSKPDSGF